MAADHVIAKISADISELKAELQKGNKEFQKFGQKLDKALPEDPFKRIKKGLQDLLSVAAVVAPFKAAGQAATEFEAELRSLNTITDMSEQALAQYGDGLRTLSLELGTTTGAAENARAAYDVASAGFVAANDNAAVLSATLRSASAGGVEAAEAAKLLSGTLRAYGADAQDAGKFSDIFFQVVKKGITTFPDLTNAMGNVTAIASSAGITIEELGAAMATLTNRGIDTDKASVALRGAIVQLLAPSAEAQKEMARLGITVNETTLKQDGLLKTLLKIRDANGGSAESFKKLLGDVRAVQGALALTSDAGALFKENMEAMTNAAGSTDAALSEKSKSFKHSIAQFKVALEAAGVSVGSVFLPVAKTMLDTVTGLTSAFATAPKPIQDLITAVATLGGTYLLTTKGLSLLTTKKQFDTIVTGANTAAQVLNTTVTWQGTKAAAANVVAKGRMAVSTAAATASTTSLTGAMTAARAAVLGTAASIGILVAAGGSLIYLANETAKAWNEAAKSLDEFETKAAKASASIDEGFDSIGKSAEELRKMGKTVGDLNNELEAFKEAQVTIKNSDLGEADKERQLKKLREGFAKLKATRDEFAEAEKRDAARKKAESESVVKSPEVSEKDQKKAARKEARDAEKERKESVEAELSRIEILRKSRQISTQEEIALLQESLKTLKVNADEKRSIQEKIAGLQGGLKDDAGEKKAKAETERGQAIQRNFELRLQELQAEKELAKTAEERFEIERQIVQLETQQALNSEKDAQNRSQIAENAKDKLAAARAKKEEDQAKEKAQAAEQSQGKEKELLELKAKGLEIELQSAETEKEKLRIRESLIKLRGEIDLVGEDDADLRAQKEKNVQSQLKAAREEAAEAEEKRHEKAMGNLEKEEQKVQKLRSAMRGDVLDLDQFVDSSSMGFGESRGKKPADAKGTKKKSGLPGLVTDDKPTPIVPDGSEARETAGGKPETGEAAQGAMESGSVTPNLLVELTAQLNSTLQQILQEIMKGNSGNASSSNGQTSRDPVKALPTPDRFQPFAQ